VRDLELDDRPAADEGCADARTGLGGLRDGRVDDAQRPEAVQESGRDLEEAAQLADVLADHEHAALALHLLLQRLVQRLRHGPFPSAVVGHDSRPAPSQSAGAYTSSRAAL